MSSNSNEDVSAHTGSDSDSNILETIQKADVVGFFGQ
jgi:hypothetical protein